MPTVSETTAVRRGEPRERYTTHGIVPRSNCSVLTATSSCQRAVRAISSTDCCVSQRIVMQYAPSNTRSSQPDRFSAHLRCGGHTERTLEGRFAEYTPDQFVLSSAS
jgi:hypothetical protein